LMVSPGDDATLDELLAGRYDRLAEIVNEDLLNLRISLYALNQRVEVTGGPLPEEVEIGWSPVLEWARTVGLQKASELLVVGLWSALESFVQDVFALICSRRSYDIEQLPKVNVQLSRFLGLNDEERWGLVWDRATEGLKGSNEYAVDRFDAVLKPLGVGVDVQPDPKLPEAFRLSNETVRRSLRELQAIRNAIVHGQGRADPKVSRLDSSTYPINEPIVLTDEAMVRFGVAVHSYAATLANAASDNLNLE